jgi:hypothetical protein
MHPASFSRGPACPPHECRRVERLTAGPRVVGGAAGWGAPGGPPRAGRTYGPAAKSAQRPPKVTSLSPRTRPPRPWPLTWKACLACSTRRRRSSSCLCVAAWSAARCPVSRRRSRSSQLLNDTAYLSCQTQATKRLGPALEAGWFLISSGPCTSFYRHECRLSRPRLDPKGR